MERIQRFFDQQASRWDEYSQINEPLLSAVFTLLDIPSNSRILDVGSGTGAVIPLLLQQDPSQLDAIDLSGRMVERAQQKFQHPALHVQQADFYRYDAALDYDFVMIYNAYPHFLDKAGFASKLQALLKKDGRFVLLHGSSRNTINSRHYDRNATGISVPLQAVEAEQQWFDPYFSIDMKLDTDTVYLLSGVKNS